MPEHEFDPAEADPSDGATIIPIVEEKARIIKRASEIDRVTVRTIPEQEAIVVRDQVRHEQVDVTRVAIDREVAEAPAIRTEGDVTIVPVIEERLVVEKRLFLVEELHLRRTTHTETIELPTSVLRTRVEIDRKKHTQEEDR